MTLTAESTAALRHDDYMQLTAERIGYGLRKDQAAGLSADEESEVTLYVKEGYREFILAYEWSFMRPTNSSVLWPTTTGTVSGTPSKDNGTTSVTATANKFYPSMVGRTFTFDTSGTGYEIASYTSATDIKVTGDASGETADDTFTITADGFYAMPFDFGGLLGEVFFDYGDGRWLPLDQVGVAELLEQLMITTGTGRPTQCAINPHRVDSGDTRGQRHDLMAWRIPDAIYTVRYQYQVLPDVLVTNDYPYGGAMHAQTILYSCFAAAERGKQKLVNGPDQQYYDKLLRGSIKRDQRGTRADKLGFMVNAQVRGRRHTQFLPFAQNITVGGESFP
jgi:hypothetical protein